MPARLVTILLFLLLQQAQAQYATGEKRLIVRVEKAHSDKEKIEALGNLAEYYYIYRAVDKGDSTLQKQLLMAELANNKELIGAALFGSALDNITAWSSSETFDRALAFLDKGLNYAKESGQKEYETLAYLRKASLLRKRGQYDKAIQQTTFAFPSLDETGNDSLKAKIYLEIGDNFLEKKDFLAAFKNYNTAFEIAYRLKNVPLQSDAYHNYSKLYQLLGDADLAKKSLLTSLDLNLTSGNLKGLLVDYIDLARLTDQKEYIDKAFRLADSLKLEHYKLYVKRIQFAILMAVEKSSEKALKYLAANDDLKHYYQNQGSGNYSWIIGSVYHYSAQPDSALFYYSLAEPEVTQSFDASKRRTIYDEMGDCYRATQQSQKAIQYFEKALLLAKTQNDYGTISAVSQKLGELYAATDQYKKAYAFIEEHLRYKDTLQELAAQKDIVLMEVDRQKRKQAKDLEDLALQKIKQRNLQYFAMSIAITALFLFLILIGMFPVSRIVIRMTGFFSFICLFEFIILLIDNYIHHLTHGDALKIWLIKIGVIAILLPLHHLLEHLMVRFLESQKLLRLRQRWSAKKLWPSTKKPTPVKETAAAEDGAVTVIEKNEPVS